MKGRSRKSKGKRLAASSSNQNPRPRTLQGPPLLSPTLAQALRVSLYALLSIVVASVVAICTHYGAEIGHAIFGGSMAVGAAIFTISQLVLSLLLAALTVTDRIIASNCWEFLVNIYGLGSGVVGSAIAACDQYGPEVGQAVVGRLTTVSNLPFIISCVLSMLLAAVTAWRLCLNCWGFVWTASRLLWSTCRWCKTCLLLEHLHSVHLDKALWVSVNALWSIVVGFVTVICTYHGAEIGQAFFDGLVALGTVTSATSGGLLPLLVACAVAGAMLCMQVCQGFVWKVSRLWQSTSWRGKCIPVSLEDLPVFYLQKKEQSSSMEGKGDAKNDVQPSHSKTITKLTDQHPEQHQDGAGKAKDAKAIPNAQQPTSESAPSVSADLPHGSTEPAEQPSASFNNNKAQRMTKSQKQREKKKQAAAQVQDAQASNNSTSKGPQTPPETTPTRAKISPAPSPDSTVVNQTADKPAVDNERVQDGEWVHDRASKRKAQQAKRGLPSNAGTQAPSSKNGFNTASNNHAATRKKAHINSLPRQTVRSSTVLSHMTKSATMTGSSHPKPMSGKTYSSAIGQAMGVRTDVVVPLVGHKAPIKGLEQLDKLPRGASAFTAFRSVRGDGDCAFRAIVVAMLEQTFLGTTNMRKMLLSKLTLSYIFLQSGYCTPDVELGHNTFQDLLQTMLEGPSKLHWNQVLQLCFDETSCNVMVSLLRAITADGFCNNPDRWLTALRVSTECESVDIELLSDVFVRPLACKHKDDLWQQRWPDHPHLQVLAESLGLNFMVHNIQSDYYVTSFGSCADHSCVFHMLHTGCHYQLLHK